MAVIELASYKNLETISVLRKLLRDAIAGDLSGVAICYRARDGYEDSAFTGAYKARPADAVNAAMRLSWKLTQAQDTTTRPPRGMI